jgi:hypothetical protein
MICFFYSCRRSVVIVHLKRVLFLLCIGVNMLSAWVIAGLIAAGAAAGGLTGYAVAKRKGYSWNLAYDPYWRRWVWVPTYQ